MPISFRLLVRFCLPAVLALVMPLQDWPAFQPDLAAFVEKLRLAVKLGLEHHRMFHQERGFVALVANATRYPLLSVPTMIA